MLWTVLMGMLFVFVFGGCGGGGDSASTGPDVTSRPAAVLGTLPKELPFLPYFEKRLLNKTASITEDTELVVLHNNGVDTLTDEEKRGVKNVYNARGIVVLIEPTLSELTELSSLVGAHLSAAVDTGAKPFCDIYAFVDSGTGFHTYVLDSLLTDEEVSVAYSNAAEQPRAEEEPTDEEKNLMPANPEPPHALPSKLSADEYEKIMAHFIEWIDSNGPATMPKRLARVKERAAATDNDILNLVKAQTITFNNNMTAPLDLNGFRPTALYSDTYFIYALYDSANRYDYYIFDQEEILTSGNMYKGLWTNSDWGSYTNIMGYYLYDYYTDHYLQTSSGAFVSSNLDIVQPQPATSTGSTSYTTSQALQIGGSLGFNGMGGTGSISGSVTYTQSHTTSIPDMSVANQANESVKTGSINNARWTYLVGNLPKSQNNYTIIYPHDSTITPEPPLIARSTATLYNSWMWRVKNPSGTYNVLCRSRPRYAYSKCRASWPNFRWIDNGKLGDDTINNGWTQERTINLIAPPRS
jgi:hypothetical protein